MEINESTHKKAVDNIVENIHASDDLIKNVIEISPETFEEAQVYVDSWKLQDEIMSMITTLRAKEYEVCNFIIKSIANGDIEIVDCGYDDKHIRELMMRVVIDPSKYTIAPFHVTEDGYCVFAIKTNNFFKTWRLELTGDLKKLVRFDQYVPSF